MSRKSFSSGRRALVRLTVMAMIVSLVPVVAISAGTSATAAAVTFDILKIQVVNAREAGGLHMGQPIPAQDINGHPTTYTWLITADDVGNPDQAISQCQNGATNYPEGCQWPSIRQTPGAVSVVAQGDQSALSATHALAGLPAGKYLISLLANGYTLGGQHFIMPLPAQPNPAQPDVLVVPVQPNPVPLGTMRIRVFHDNAPVDATYEAGTETGNQGGQGNLTGFEAHLSDVYAEVTTDWFGNPLCSNYVHSGGKMVFDGAGSPTIDPNNPGGRCLSNSAGDIVIPNIGSNRYGVTLSKPANKSTWVQTTTLEGAHDHDVWIINGDNGLDSELVVGGEPVPWVQFGYVEQRLLSASTVPTAHVTGQILAGLSYVGGNGGVTIPGGTGTAGGKEGPPIVRPWISLSDLNNGDQMVYTGRGNADGTFDIPNVRDSSYQITVWDDDQEYILFSFNVTVKNHQDVDTGKNYLSGWMTRIYGSVFIDTNGNGIRDAGEQGVPETAITLRERDNSLIDQFTSSVTTDSSGNYTIKEAYPLTRWLILEHFNTRYYGTGATVQGENDPSPTTFHGAAVDINVLPVLGLGGRVDWGVKPYAAGTNGGIVGTVSYDTTRNELDPAYSVAERYQPGIPGIGVHLFSVLKDTRRFLADSSPNPDYGMPILDTRGLAQKGPALAATYTSETWSAPKGCTARQWDGSTLTGLSFIPPGGLAANNTCVESAAMGFQARPSDTTQNAWGQTVNGNYGFATSDLNQFLVDDQSNPGYPTAFTGVCPAENDFTCTPGHHDLPLNAVLADFGYDPQPLNNDDYIVAVDIPNNPVGGGKMYQVTREQDVNIFNGDSYLPVENFPISTNPVFNPPVVNGGNTTPPVAPPSQGGGFSISPCVGTDQTVDVTNPSFLDNGGSPYQGQNRPLCDEKLVTVRGQSAAAPTFTMFTATPLPTHFWGLTINDLGLSWDKRSIQYGEAQGLPGVPMGIYDFSGRLVDTVKTDFNGFYEAIEPSTSSYNCPLPAGPCPGMYRFVGNDPGQPGAPNANYNSRYRTIATNFQAWPGLFTVTDTAPTQTGAVVTTPGTTTPVPVNCSVSDTTPEIFSVDKVVAAATANSAARTVTITGDGFGPGSNVNNRVELVPANVTVTDPVLAPAAITWGNRGISFVVPGTTQGPLQLRVRNGVSGKWSSSAITIQLTRATGPFSTRYDPLIREVGPGKSYATVQAGIAAVATGGQRDRQENFGRVVVVSPGNTSSFNPDGAYLENVVLNERVKLQGFGPGGVYSDGGQVRGSVISGAGYDPDGPSGLAWSALVTRPHAGQAGVPDGAVITVLPSGSSVRQARQQFSSDDHPLAFAAIDGFKITGGYQLDVGVNQNVVTGGYHTGYGAPGATVTQGGGIYVHAFARNLRVSNNLVIGNSGSYAGGIRVGTPYAAVTDNQNDDVHISYNRVRDNGGTNLAGGIGLFNGSDNYLVDHNDICGNFSSEYGGGISQFGFSPGGKIDQNRVYFNESYDEGAGVFLAGELPANPADASRGTGEETISANEIVANNANDDGGGLRLLQIGNYPSSGPGSRPAADRIGYLVRVVNNIIADNMSTHEGGGIALDDAANVQIVSNTVARNITTATAVTSDGSAAAAGLSVGKNSVQLQGTLPVSAATFSNPVLLDDIFWQNEAGTWDGTTVTGIGIGGTTDRNYWDMGSTDGSGALAPRSSILTSSTSSSPQVLSLPSSNNLLAPTNTTAFVNPYFISVDISTLRTFPGFRQSVIVVSNVPPDLLGSYAIGSGSTAIDLGITRSVYGTGPGAVQVTAPTIDIDGDSRYVGSVFQPAPAPANTPKRIDAGADER